MQCSPVMPRACRSWDSCMTRSHQMKEVHMVMQLCQNLHAGNKVQEVDVVMQLCRHLQATQFELDALTAGPGNLAGCCTTHKVCHLRCHTHRVPAPVLPPLSPPPRPVALLAPFPSPGVLGPRQEAGSAQALPLCQLAHQLQQIHQGARALLRHIRRGVPGPAHHLQVCVWLGVWLGCDGGRGRQHTGSVWQGGSCRRESSTQKAQWASHCSTV